MRCFVTVGTTKFDSLINKIMTEPCLEILRQRGVSYLVLQSGAGIIHIGDNKRNFNGIQIEQYCYKDDIKFDMEAADFIIGHAGAGTCLEALKLRKPLIVVVNEDLMGNHQLELAERLADEGHIFYTDVTNLLNLLQTVNFSELKPFVPCDMHRLAKFIDKCT